MGSLSVAIGDFNGDGNADLAVVNGNANSVTILLGDGTGNFTATANPVTTGRDPYIVAVGDFNGDGKPDLAVANSLDNTVSIFLGDGAGGFTQSGNAITVGSSPQGLTVGDFNGDGKLDLATSNVESNNVTILLGNGDGTFTPTGVSPATGIKPTSIATGDFNGDGKLDLAVANYGSSNNVTILLGDGTGAFTAESVSPSVLFNATDIVVSDFNGDGRADLAVVNSANSNVTILLGVDTPTQITASPTTGQSATVGTAFGTPLSVTLLDAFNNPVQGVQVTFTAPTGSGIASGTFASSATVTTNSQGVATAPTFTANGVVRRSVHGHGYGGNLKHDLLADQYSGGRADNRG